MEIQQHKKISKGATKAVVVRKPLSDEDKFRILTQYSQGIPVQTIASSFNRDKADVQNLIDTMAISLSSVKETNDLLKVQCTADFQRIQGTTPTRFLSSDFLHKAVESAEIYAYYYAQTGDNKFSLEQAQLDQGINNRVTKLTKDYILRVRGQYLRDIPQVKRYIKEVQDRRIKEYHLEKPQIQMELVNQIEELKEVCTKDVRQRSNLLKAIEMLGKTIGAFTERIEVEEVDAKSGLQLILEKAKREVLEGTTSGYSIEDVDGKAEEGRPD